MQLTANEAHVKLPEFRAGHKSEIKNPEQQGKQQSISKRHF